MNIFGNFSWQYFMQLLAAGIGIGAIVSICIRLNLKAQSKFKSDPNSGSKFFQSITYVGCLLAGLPAIFFLGVFATDHLDNSPIDSVIFIIGIVSPIVFAFRSGFVPANKTGEQSKAP